MVAIEHRQKSSTAATATTIEIETEESTTATINIADVLSPTSSASSVSAASNTTTTTTSSIQQQQQQAEKETKQTLKEKKQLVEEALKTNQKLLIQQKQSSKSDRMSSQLETPPPAAEIVTSEQAKQSKAGVGGAVSKSAVSQRNVDLKITKKSNIDAATKELTKKVLKLDLTGKELEEFSVKSPKSPIARLPHQTSLTSSVDVEDRKTLREALYQGIFHRHRRTIFAVGSFLRMLRSRNSQYNTIRSSSEGEEGVEEVAR
ncbi:probable protein phosphatase DDB_G0282105 [Eurosta solidaginis]|uniref:probable protein phosphatase DDB_G0282105 n=1 Tax=Eurosta solidaginis TaxID=178769 RepID=UPI003531736F